MSTSDVVRLDEYRGRREQRLRQALALHGAYPERSTVVRSLWQAVQLTGGDRAATLWVDEYGPGLLHVHCLLDLASDQPRREFASDVVRQAWNRGVPGLLDVPDVDAGSDGRILPGSPRSMAAVALGSDGVRAWFLAVDSRTPRPVLGDGVAEAFMFVAGECASILLHRDMDDAVEQSSGQESYETIRRERFSGWPVLQDVERQEDDVTSRRITSRFLVTRLLRSLVDDDLAVDDDALTYQVEGVRREVRDTAVRDAESRAWDRVLEAVESRSYPELPGAVLELSDRVEWQGHVHGARELHRLAFDIAVAVGDLASATDAARLLGRVCRRMTQWQESEHWYGSAREIARAGGLRRSEALVLDGMGNLKRMRGNFPEARRLYREALEIGTELGDGYVLGSAHQNLMVVEKHDERTDKAARHGWAAVEAYESEQWKLAALADLGDLFIRSGELGAAEDALRIVAARIDKVDYRVAALDALGHIAALRGDGAEFRARVERVSAEPWHDVSPGVRAEVLLFRGKSHLALGDLDEARDALRRALDLAERHGVNRVLFKAEGLLEGVARQARVEELLTRELPEPADETVAEIREPLGRLAGQMMAGAAP